MFYQIIDELLAKNKIILENIVYINFSNLLFKNFDVEKLLEEYFSLFPDKEPVFFLDEIQELENFNKILLFLQANNYQVFAT
jgi:predicted AAA+ superfamily ATPase